MPSALPPCVRRASTADVDTFTDHRLAVFREVHALGDGACAESLATTTRAAFAELLPSDACHVWLAVQEAAVLGSAALHTFARFPSPSNPCAREAYVSHVYVAPPWRRTGVGTALLQALIAGARDQGLRRIRLHATESGRALYETLGFRLRSNDMELVL